MTRQTIKLVVSPADRVSKGTRMGATALVNLETGSCQCHRTEVELTVPKLANHINLTDRSNRSVSTAYSTLADMDKQLALLLVGLAITNAVYVNYENPYGAYNNPPLAVPVAISEHPGFQGNDYAYPRYSFNYGVNDPHTGDVKSQEEVREGDVVKGSYSLNEPDGTIRVVEYTADDHNGFNAIVKKIGNSIHPEEIPVVQYTKLVPAHYSHVNYDGYY